MGRGKTGIVPVKTAPLEGVSIPRELEREAQRMVSLVSRLGRRLTATIRTLPPESLPDVAWLETFGRYDRAMRGLLAEQRERAKLIGRGAQIEISDAEFQAEIEAAAEEWISGLTDEEFERFLASRPTMIPEPPLCVPTPLVPGAPLEEG